MQQEKGVDELRRHSVFDPKPRIDPQLALSTGLIEDHISICSVEDS